MIVVIGSPVHRPALADRPPGAAGSAVEIALAATAAGGTVQLVGRVGEDRAGDATLLALTAAGIGHVATLRDPARPTPLESEPAGFDADRPLAGIADLDDSPAEAADDRMSLGPDDVSTLDPADVGLALRYLDDYRVIVLVEPMSAAGLQVVGEAAAFGGARLVIVVADGGGVGEAPAGAVVIEAPASDPDGLFTRTVGRFAFALDQGADPESALATAAAVVGWERSAD